MNSDISLGMFSGFLGGMLINLLLVFGLTFPISKSSWTCSTLSQPKTLGESVECIQYTKSK